MGTYKCKNCGYKAVKERRPETCNYCSKKDSMMELESAEKLIEDL